MLASSVGSGKVGDVIVPDESWFNENGGVTFFLLGNPYGDDTIIFKAVGIDRSLKKGELNVYIPGADDNSTPIAQAWRNKADKSMVVVPSNDTSHFRDNKPVSIVPSIVAVAQAEYDHIPKHGDIVDYNLTANGKEEDPWQQSFVTWCLNRVGLLDAHHIMPSQDKAEFYNQINNTHPEWMVTGTLLPGDIVYLGNSDKSNDRVGIVGSSSNNGFNIFIGDIEGTIRIVAGAASEISGAIRIPGAQKSDLIDPSETRRGSSGGNNSSDAQGGYIDSAKTLNDQSFGEPNYSGPDQIDIALSTSVSIPMKLPTTGAEAIYFTGPRALQNDVPLLEWVQDICTSSGRVFQSMPNGDFLAFYPNYFNWASGDPLYSQPYLELSDLELIDLTIDLTDEPLATHVYTVGDVNLNSDPSSIWNQIVSAWGSIEEFRLIKDFINLPADFDPAKFMNRYGARPLTITMPQIKNPIVLAIWAWMNFFFQWSKQFQVNLQMTFLPELYPGGLILLKSHDLLLFVEEVVHTFDRSSGFTTTATLSAPAGYGKNNHNYGMVLAGNLTDVTQQSPIPNAKPISSSGGGNQPPGRRPPV